MPSVELRPFFWLISEKLELVHGMQFCTPVGPQTFQSDLTVDIDKLQALFQWSPRIVRKLERHAAAKEGVDCQIWK